MTFRTALLSLACCAAAQGQVLVLKDGAVQETVGIARNGDKLICQVPGTNGSAGTIAFAVVKVDRIEFPETTFLEDARGRFQSGRTDDALAAVDQAIAGQAPFRDIPGNYWGEAALLKLNILRSAGRHAKADPLLDELLKVSTDPEISRAAKAHDAVRLAISGKADKALALFDEVAQQTSDPATLALIALHRGNTLLTKQDYERALLSYLRLPVFYPDQQFLAAPALLGSARAFIGMDDLRRARTALNDIITSYSSLPEAAIARTELQKVERKIKARNLDAAPSS